MRKVILAVVALILLPSAGFSQQPFVSRVCSQVDPSVATAHGSRVVEKENLKLELEKALTNSNHVVVCREETTKSSGHGVFGLIDWDKRKVAEIKFHKIEEGKNNYILTDTVKYTELKAPLGKWHIAKDDPPKFHKPKIILNPDKSLPDISKADSRDITYRITALTQ